MRMKKDYLGVSSKDLQVGLKKLCINGQKSESNYLSNRYSETMQSQTWKEEKKKKYPPKER